MKALNKPSNGPEKSVGNVEDLAEEVASAPVKEWWRSSPTAGLLLCVVLLFAAVYSYFCSTQFSGGFARLSYMDHYRYLADGIRNGTLSVYDDKGAPMAGCMDCLQFQGRRYIAYGPLPAVFQMVTDHLLGWRVPSGAVVWLLVNAALVLFAVTLVRFLHRLMGLAPGTSILIASATSALLATSEIFLHTALVPFAWSQASATGQLLLVAALAFLLQHRLHPAPRWIAAATVCAGAAALCKQNYFPALAGVGVALFVVNGRGERSFLRRENLVAYGISATACIVLFLGYNAARFGNPFDNGSNYVNASDAKPIFHSSPKVHRVPMNLFNHFFAGYRFDTTDWPLLAGKSDQFNGIKPDGSGGLLHNHPMFSIFLSMPMLLLGVAGGLWGFRVWFRTRNPWAGWIVGGWCLGGSAFLYYLAAEASWSRYRYDFLYPAALVSVIAGVLAYRAAEPYRFLLRPAALIVLPLVFGWQSFVGIDQALGTMFSRDHRFIHWGANLTPGYSSAREKAHLLRAVLFERQPALPMWTDRLPAPADFPVGTLAIVSPGDRIHRYNGFAWKSIWHDNRVPVGVSFVLPPSRLDGWQPLLEMGAPGRAQGVGITQLDEEQYQFRYDFWGVHGCLSPLLPLRTGVPYQIWLDLQPPASSALYLDSEIVMECAIGSFLTAGETVNAGVNGIGFNTMGRRFAGAAHLLDGRSGTMQVVNVPHSGVDVSVWLPQSRTKDPEPLIQFGSQSGLADLLSVQYVDGYKVRLMYDHWGAPTCFSNPVEMPPDRRFRIHAELQMGMGKARFRLDGQELFECSNGVFPQAGSGLLLGKNTLGFTTAMPEFRGRAVLDAASEGVELRVKFPDRERTSTEPVAQFGSEPGRADLLGVRYENNGSIRLMYDHWGVPSCISEPLDVPRETWQTIRYALDFQGQLARFWLNGKEVAACRNGVYEKSLHSIALGRNVLGFTTVGTSFSGQVWLAGAFEGK